MPEEKKAPAPPVPKKATAKEPIIPIKDPTTGQAVDRSAKVEKKK